MVDLLSLKSPQLKSETLHVLAAAQNAESHYLADIHAVGLEAEASVRASFHTLLSKILVQPCPLVEPVV
eukprot:998311-Rhodomonas_salina.2